MTVDADEPRRIHSQRQQQREEASGHLQIETKVAELSLEDSSASVVRDLLRHVQGFHLIDAVRVGDLADDIDILGDVLGEKLVRDGDRPEQVLTVVAEIQDESLLGEAHVDRREALDATSGVR